MTIYTIAVRWGIFFNGPKVRLGEVLVVDGHAKGIDELDLRDVKVSAFFNMQGHVGRAAEGVARIAEKNRNRNPVGHKRFYPASGIEVEITQRQEVK